MFTSTQPLVLASASPRRRELLASLVPADGFIVRPPANFVEPECPPAASLAEVASFAQTLASAKADAAASEFGSEHPILAADTIVVADGEPPQIMEKPPEDDRYERTVVSWLSDLAGRSHHVFSGLTLLSGGQRFEAVAVAEVTFDADAAEAARWYAGTGEPRGKAGGYAIQGLGSAFVTGLRGEFTTVVGLPLLATRRLLRGAGFATLW